MKSLPLSFSVFTLVFILSIGLTVNLSAQTLNDDGNTHTINANGSLQQNGSVQDYTIPSNPIYNSIRFALRGGDGGFAKAGNNCQSNGGEGATTTVVFWVGNGTNELKPGGTIRFIVGKYGENGDVGGTSGTGAGGGGGTAVLYRPDASSNWEILAVAGGGGGAYQGNIGGGCVDSQAGQGGRSLTGGGNGEGPNAGSGGTNGDGGEGADAVNNILSGGGGGAFSDGGQNGGKEGFPNGGNGGTAGNEGGYGFGGGGWGGAANSHGGGGGGGYSGGGGGGTANNGGGGGSYVNANYNFIYSQKSAGSTGGGNEVNGDVDYTFEDTEIVWTGAVDDDWHNSGNWSPARVPQLIDVVDINAATNDPIIWDSNQANAKVVRVFSGGDLTIGTNAILNIEPIDRNGIFNEGTITNDNNGTINISGYDNFDGIRNDGGTFINTFGAVINIEDMDRYGIWNKNGTFNNNTGGTINIGTASSPIGNDGILNDPGCTFINSGTLKIRNTAGHGIENHGAFASNANALIRVDQTTTHGIRCQAGTFTNNGEIKIGELANIGSRGIDLQNASIFNNNASGIISLWQTTSYGVSTFDASVFQNSGDLSIGGLGGSGIQDVGLVNSASFFNNAGGEIFIDQTGSVGLLNNLGATTFNNEGDITIGSIDAIVLDGIQSSAPFNNLTTGSIIIDQTLRHGIFSSLYSFTNEGLIKIGENGNIGINAIFTQGVNAVFINSECNAVIHIFDKNINDTQNNFTNSGTIVQESTGNSNINTNNGVIVYNAGSFTVDNGNTPVSVSGSFTGKKLWTGCDDGDWDSTLNWYPGSVPNSSDEVVVYPVGISSPIISFGTSAMSQSVSVEDGASLFNDGSLTVSGGIFDIKSGATAIGNGQYTLSGNFRNNGTYTPGVSTVSFVGTSNNQYIWADNPTTFYNLVIDRPSNLSVKLVDELTVLNDLPVNSGKLEVQSSGILTVHNLSVDNGGTLFNEGMVSTTNQNGSLWIKSGATAQGNGQYSIKGNFLLDGGIFNPGTSTVTMTGNLNNTISSDPVTFYNLIINKPSDKKVTFEDVTVQNDLTVTSGDLEILSGYSLTCPFLHLESGSDLTNEGSLTCNNGFLWIKSGATADGNGQYTLEQDFIVSSGGIFTSGTSTVTMTGPGDYIIGDIPISFYNLEIDKTSGNMISINDNLTISNELNMISGNLDLAGSDIELSGNGTIIGESAASYIYDTNGGVVKKTIDLNAPTSENPGNIGASITSSANLGSTIIQRGHEVQDVNGEVSIKRYYDISPTNNSGLDATVRFHYLDHELNGLPENDLAPFRYNGSTWDQYLIANNDATANWVETQNVDAFSLWTLAECIPLTFYADADGDGFGDPAVSILDCAAQSGYVSDNTDCDDSDANEFPGQTWYEDADSDGYTTGTTQVVCERPTGYRTASELVNTTEIDCNDSNPAVNPNPDCSTITRTWTGHISTDWNEACNWSPNCVPTGNDDVIIPNKANDPIISGGITAVAKSVRVNISGILTIQSGAGLDIDNAANDGIYLNSHGTLINSGVINIGATTTGGNGILLKNDSQLTNDGGTINIVNTSNRGIRLEVETNFNNINSGQVLIGQSGGSIGGNGIYMIDANGWNNNNSTVVIDNTTQVAISVNSSLPFTNQNNGQVLIGQNSGNIQGSGISISNTIVRNYNAILRIDNTTQNGIEVTAGTFDNKNGGEVYIGEIGNVGGNAILMNSGQGLLNQSCSLIKATKPIYYSSTPVGTNDGIIIEDAGGTSRIKTNNGVVQNLGGGSFTITNNNGTLSESADEVVWTGCGDTQWSNGDNWHTGAVPTTSSDVIIPNVTNAPVIPGGFTALPNGLVIETGATLTNNGKLRIVSPSTGDLWIKSGGTLQGDGNYDLDGDWINDGSFQAGTSKVDLYGTTQIKGSSQTDFNLLIFLGGTFSLETPISVSNVLALAINSTLDLNGYDITLLGNAYIGGENQSNYIYSTAGGVVKKIQTLNAPTGVNPGNLGVTITSSANLGSTIIQRGHEVQDVNGEVSILRTYDISPANNSGLDATVRFHYLDHELNGIAENDLAPFRFNGSTWDEYTATNNDVTANWVETDGIDAFSLWTLSAEVAPLPVELVDFQVKKVDDSQVQLSWQTATEINNEGFEVEHSTDGRNWDYLGFVEGHGTSSDLHDYVFSHETPSKGVNYYRLLQLDFDGQFEYSEIRSVAFEGLNNQIKVFPNPAKTYSNIQLPGEYQQAHIIVSDLNGRTVYEQRLERGNSNYTLNVGTWESGMYLIRVQIDGRVATHKLQVIND